MLLVPLMLFLQCHIRISVEKVYESCENDKTKTMCNVLLKLVIQ